ncbi:MAG TPA: glycosyltransferase [Flavipsychrobacter sp.]|nr:glycosyltransferase [Flavipsychrobacter sp.]
MVSVCMATFNGEQFIQDQLNSILKQISEEDEIVICDDYSSDRTVEIIKSYNDNRIKLFVNEDRLGIIRNFEKSLMLASKPYIFLADQDDIWESRKIDICMELLNEYDLVLSNCSIIDQNKKIVNDSYFSLRKGKVGFVNNLIKNSFLGSCMAFRRSVLLKSLPFPKSIAMHDWWIGLVASLFFKCIVFEMPLVLHRVHDNNSSTTGKPSSFSAKKKILIRVNILISLLRRNKVKIFL